MARKLPQIEGREVLLWDTAIEEPCFALPLRASGMPGESAWLQPEQARLYRKSLQ